MKPIINPWLFYHVDCLEGLQIVFIIAVIALAFAILLLTATISDLGWNEKEEIKSARRTRKILTSILILLLIVSPLILSKETCCKMKIASQVTDNNIQKAEDTIKNSVDYIFEKINER